MSMSGEKEAKSPGLIFVYLLVFKKSN